MKTDSIGFPCWLGSLFAISAASLAYEITLMRLFSITQWHHFAYMIISIALLGFGTSGTCISMFRPTLTRHFAAFYRIFAFLFPLCLLGSYVLSQYNDFNPFEFAWNPRQCFYLLEYYLVLFLPFLGAALCVGLMFTQYTSRIGLVYCANLVGSGAGALLAVGCFYILHPVCVLYVIVGVALSGGLMTFFDGGARKMFGRIVVSFLVLTVVVWSAVRSDPLNLRGHLHVSQYKGLSAVLHFPDAQILTESVSPLGVVHTVSSPAIRHAPGLSLAYSGPIPSQRGLFVDSNNAGSIVSAEQTAYLDFLVSSLAYHVRSVKTALILGAGGGLDVRNALTHGATSIDAVEINPQILWLVSERFRGFTASLYSRPEIRLFAREARGFVEAARDRYDLIQLSLLDSFAASAAGVYALHENYLYTVEALQRYYEHLTPQGVVSITRWIKFPPRDNIKLFATAVEALEQAGVSDVGQHLVSVRGWAASTLLISKSPLTGEEALSVRRFCQERSFDVNYYPGIAKDEVNRYNQLPSPEYYQTSQALLFGDREGFYATYPYYVRPARDDSPYFFHFFTWKSLPVLLRTMGKEWIPFVEWGYLILIATLLQAGLISFLLILLPLKRFPRRTRYKWFTGVYFFCLGLGYLFLEMVCIQKFTFFLTSPVSSVSVVIASFLMFSGFGSFFFEWRVSPHVGTQIRGLHFRRHAILAIGCLTGVAVLYAGSLPWVFAWGLSWPFVMKVLISILWIAPVGFCMGIPFPLGLKLLHDHSSHLVPWAYGINGYASVISSLLATCLAISFGFPLVVIWAGLLYLLAALIAVLTFL